MPKIRKPGNDWFGSALVLLTAVVNTVPRSVRVCWLRITQTITMTVTPTMCHQTDTSLSSLTRLIPNVLSRAWMTSITP